MNWYKLATDQTELQSIRKAILAEFPQIEDLWISVNDRYIDVGNIKIKKEFRNMGIGTKVINKIKEYAAAINMPVVLSPSPEKGKKSALNRFYKGLDFIPNKGRNRDYQLSSPFAGTMYWKPDKNLDQNR